MVASIPVLWLIAALMWNSIFIIVSVFLLLISIVLCFFVLKIWKVYYSPIMFTVILLGTGVCIVLLTILLK